MTREFSDRTSSRSSLIFGACFWVIGIGIIFLHVFIGILLIILGVVFFFFMRYNGSDTIVSCHDMGFNVKVINKRKGTSVNDYKWEDVTSTEFYEKKIGRADEQITSYYFVVKTGENIAFNLPQTRELAYLVEIFNLNTPHLPYYWAKPKGILTTFEKIDRNEI